MEAGEGEVKKAKRWKRKRGEMWVMGGKFKGGREEGNGRGTEWR